MEGVGPAIGLIVVVALGVGVKRILDWIPRPKQPPEGVDEEQVFTGYKYGMQRLVQATVGIRGRVSPAGRQPERPSPAVSPAFGLRASSGTSAR